MKVRAFMIFTLLAAVGCAITSACCAIAGDVVAAGIYIVAAALFSTVVEVRILSERLARQLRRMGVEVEW